MTDEFALNAADKPANKPRGKPLAKGFDPRRWLQGRPRIPKDRQEAQKIIDNVIWEELSRTITNPDSKDEVDALRLMIRSMIRNKNMQDKILDRILGKVSQNVELTGKDGAALIPDENEVYNRIMARIQGRMASGKPEETTKDSG